MHAEEGGHGQVKSIICVLYVQSATRRSTVKRRHLFPSFLSGKVKVKVLSYSFYSEESENPLNPGESLGPRGSRCVNV